ncbi:MAG: Mur ligase family protein [Campylobacterota bacterium]|nr:Mur ligase family protein [Campylobacterota bacterium]
MYYDKIDYTVIKKAWNILENHISIPYVIHIVGTNGKGSTGRFIASFLSQENKTVLHYSSPHIMKFNERIWIDGNNSSDIELNKAHKKLQDILNSDIIEKLTYFEYTTLIALLLSHKKDFVVLEAGLGGEFDATNVVKNNLSVIPSIGLDHQEFLGDTIKEIATTKLKSCDESFIFGLNINSEVIEVKNEILKDKKELIVDKNISFKNDLPEYLENNLKLALSVLKYLNFDSKIYKLPKLFGRYQKISSNITIDVGHNPLAAKVIQQELLKEKKKVVLVYNSYKDKDYCSVLKILKPVIKEVQIIDCNDSRMINKNKLQHEINNLSLKSINFDIMNLDVEDYYLVFGSFIVVENFLKGYKNI